MSGDFRLVRNAPLAGKSPARIQAMTDLTQREADILREWTGMAYDSAVAQGWVTPPWRPSEAMYEQLAGYFRAGLTPQEGAEAAFATRQ